MFNCDKCGLCCKLLNSSELYKDLDRGDGTCIHLVGTLCGIYEDRPLLCRVEESYEVYFKNKLSIEEYFELNNQACKKIKNI